MVIDTEELRTQIAELLKSSPQLFLSWDECLDYIERVCGRRPSRGYLKNIANRRDTFRAGRYARAPLRSHAPVEAASFFRWLFGKGDGSK